MDRENNSSIKRSKTRKASTYRYLFLELRQMLRDFYFSLYTRGIYYIQIEAFTY